MDPDANLKEQLELAEKIRREVENPLQYKVSEEDVHRLAELVIALDKWLCRRGFYPETWERGRYGR